MSYRELSMIDVKEVLRRWAAGHSNRKIARESGPDAWTGLRFSSASTSTTSSPVPAEEPAPSSRTSALPTSSATSSTTSDSTPTHPTSQERETPPTTTPPEPEASRSASATPWPTCARGPRSQRPPAHSRGPTPRPTPPNQASGSPIRRKMLCLAFPPGLGGGQAHADITTTGVRVLRVLRIFLKSRAPVLDPIPGRPLLPGARTRYEAFSFIDSVAPTVRTEPPRSAVPVRAQFRIRGTSSTCRVGRLHSQPGYDFLLSRFVKETKGRTLEEA